MRYYPNHVNVARLDGTLTYAGDAEPVTITGHTGLCDVLAGGMEVFGPAEVIETLATQLNAAVEVLRLLDEHDVYGVLRAFGNKRAADELVKHSTKLPRRVTSA